MTTKPRTKIKRHPKTVKHLRNLQARTDEIVAEHKARVARAARAKAYTRAMEQAMHQPEPFAAMQAVNAEYRDITGGDHE